MRRLIAILILILTVMHLFLPAYAGKNLLVNPSFENGLEGWRASSWDTEPGRSKFNHENDGGRSGNSYASIENIKENDSRLKQTVKVKQGKKYRLAVWTRTENVGEAAKGACISISGYLDTSPDVRGTNTEWKLCEMYVTIGKGIEAIEIDLCLGGYSSINTGKAFFDDASFTEVNEIPAGAVVAAINKQETTDSQPVNVQTEMQVDRETVVFKLFLTGLILTAVALYFIKQKK